MPKNCVFSRVGDYALVVHNSIAPSAAEWDAVMVHYKSFSRQMKGILVYTEGGSPSAVQRKQFRDIFEPEKIPWPPTIILTSSQIARIAITAFNLFFDNKMRAIDPNYPDEALTSLRVPPEMRGEMLKALQGLALSIGVKTPAFYLSVR